jgi:hypothetical protein
VEENIQAFHINGAKETASKINSPNKAMIMKITKIPKLEYLNGVWGWVEHSPS